MSKINQVMSSTFLRVMQKAYSKSISQLSWISKSEVKQMFEFVATKHYSDSLLMFQADLAAILTVCDGIEVFLPRK